MDVMYAGAAALMAAALYGLIAFCDKLGERT